MFHEQCIKFPAHLEHLGTFLQVVLVGCSNDLSCFMLVVLLLMNGMHRPSERKSTLVSVASSSGNESSSFHD